MVTTDHQGVTKGSPQITKGLPRGHHRSPRGYQEVTKRLPRGHHRSPRGSLTQSKCIMKPYIEMIYKPVVLKSISFDLTGARGSVKGGDRKSKGRTQTTESQTSRQLSGCSLSTGKA